MATKQNGSVIKSFEILGLITHERPEISASVVAEELALTQSTAHRFLTTLASMGVLASYRRGAYCLGPRVEELGRMEQETNPLSSVVRPVIRSASNDLNESVMACRFSPGGPICMAVAASHRPFNVDIKVGTILPLHSTAQGKIWLSAQPRKDRFARLGAYMLAKHTETTLHSVDALHDELDAIRDQGFAVNRGENEPNLGAVAVPVRSDNYEVVLTISAFGMINRFDADFVATAKQRLQYAAKEISARFL